MCDGPRVFAADQINHKVESANRRFGSEVDEKGSPKWEQHGGQWVPIRHLALGIGTDDLDRLTMYK